MASSTPLLDFYRGTAPDTAGRTIEDVWSWDDRRLELVHDYIQWLFPLSEPSRFNPDAPVLTRGDIDAFHSDAALQARVRRSLDRMLRFFGLVRGDAAVARAPDFAICGSRWLEPANHNHLRLTRIMLFLGQAGLSAEARSLLDCLEDIAEKEGKKSILPRTLEFWRAAVAPIAARKD